MLNDNATKYLKLKMYMLKVIRLMVASTCLWVDRRMQVVDPL